jgi:succinoglycan biosynthesis transport protein ExoP
MTPPRSAAGNDVLDMSRMLHALRRQKWVLVGSVVIWSMAAVFYVVTTPKTYVAGARVILDANLQRSAEQFGGLERLANSESMMENARLIIQSDSIALEVVEQLELDRNNSYLNPPSSMVGQAIGSVIGLIRLPITLLRDAFATPDAEQAPEEPAAAAAPVDPAAREAAFRTLVARSVQGAIGVQRIGRSSAFSINFQSHDPVLAAAISNAYADAYIADVLNANFEATRSTTEWLQQRLDVLERGARTAAEEAELYRVENGLVSSRGSLISESSVARLNEDLSGAISEMALLEATVESYRTVVARGVEALKSGAGVGLGDEGDTTFVQNQQRLSEMVSRRDNIMASFGADHPQAITMQQQVDAISERLFNEIQRRLASAQGALSVSQARVEALRQSLSTAVNENSEDSSVQINLRALEQRAETLSTLYQTFLTRFQEVDQQSSFPLSNIRVINRADVPRSPAGPSGSRALAGAIVLGLMIGLLIAALREWRERYLRTGDDVSTYVGESFLGYLPLIQNLPATQRPLPPVSAVTMAQSKMPATMADVARIAMPRDLFVLSHMRSVYAETLRNIRLASEISANGQASRVLAITSVRPDEGKSTLTLNLAAMLRASGASVLVIDADIRNPGLSRMLGIAAGEGLIGTVLGRVSLDQAVREIVGSGVHVLPCVIPRGVPVSIEVLSSRALRELVDHARASYNYVLIDSAPLGPVIDARVMLPLIDQVIMVGEWGKTKKGLLRKTILNEPNLADKLLGVVLSKVDMTKLPKYLNDTNIESYYGQYSDYVSTIHR